MATKLDSRQVVLRELNPFIGNAANEQLNVVFPRIDAEMAKLYEDRNVLLTDGGIITFTGTQIQFTENLNIVLNQKISGAAPQIISLGSANVNLNNGEMWYAVVNRTAGTATTAVASTLPAVVAANQEVFLIVKRVDAGDGTQRVYWRTGMAQNAGQSNRLGASGSGSGGSGIGDDLGVLLFRASFRDPFEEGPTDTKSAVDVTSGKTDAATYNAAKAMYTLNYDASKTIAAGTTTTNINLSANAAFTVKIGDVVVANNQARRITAVANQASFTTEAFSVAPTLASQVTVSQAVHTKDVYNFAVDGNALSAAFSGATFQDVLVDYEDTTTAGDNIFDVNVAPVVALSASQDGTTFTDVKIRPTLETDQMQSFLLPAAGTGLYMRFFAYKTSGSGTINVLGYRAFMQKTTVAVAGGITNSSYAFTNGVGTPVNATVSVVGGKTTITLPWSYAVGVLAGTSASSIEVWLNGQKLPRFINSTLTPDGSFLETSSNIVTLDRDYSSQNLSVEIFQRTQIVDNSTTNTTQLSYLQEIAKNGFQGFVNQTTLMTPNVSAGTPIAGQFHSSIVGRASMVDLGQDLRVRMGIDRIGAQALQLIQTEFGPNGELVRGLANDMFGQVRFVGNWSFNNSSGGIFIINSSTTDFIEITFYGTGLNILTSFGNATYSYQYAVDGGSSNTFFNTAVGNNVMPPRLQQANQVISVVQGLTLGVHTVRLSTNSGSGMNVNGFEIINNSSALAVNPGISYVNGQKLALVSQQTPAYNSSFESGTLGVRGGRTVVYHKSDGSIGKALTPAGSQANLTNADHTNEEIARTHYFREFGTSRQDDFASMSIVGGTTGNYAFTLDDGTTTLVGNQISERGLAAAALENNTAYLTITFVGTGLDIIRKDSANGGADTYTAFVDGTSVGNLSSTGSTLTRVEKIVSGLPYGTHNVRISRIAAATFFVGIVGYRIYQPKKPAIPSGAVELADYNIMANYVADATGSLDSISTGVLRKSSTREMLYVGTWSPGLQQTIGTDPGGYSSRTTTNGDYVQYTFFGTGVEIILRGGSGTVTGTVQIDGAAYTGAATALGGSSWTPGTSTHVAGSGTATALQISGLTLGVHTVRWTATAAANTVNFIGMNIITPIHSYEFNSSVSINNSLSIGSQGISDNRAVTPIKEVLSTQKGWAQAIGVVANPTTTATSLVPMPDMSVTLRTNGGRLNIRFKTQCTSSVTNATPSVSIYVDGVPVGAPDSGSITAPATAGYQFSLSNECSVPVAAGFHKVDVFYTNGNAGTLTLSGTNRILTVEEV